MLKKISIHGRRVEYDTEEPHISSGVYHLNEHLQQTEVEMHFKEAKEKGETSFEDFENHKYNLIFQKTTPGGFFSSSVDNFVLSSRLSS